MQGVDDFPLIAPGCRCTDPTRQNLGDKAALGARLDMRVAVVMCADDLGAVLHEAKKEKSPPPATYPPWNARPMP
jgi:hypothetical protein